MAHLVFVHGVATRNTPEYQAAIANRDKLFSELLFKGDVTIYSPLWGEFVPQIPPEVFNTHSGVKTYSLAATASPGLGRGLAGGGAGGAEDASIEEIARQDPVAALDAICSAIAQIAEAEGRELNEQELQAFRNASELIVSKDAATTFQADASPEAIATALSEGGAVPFGGVRSLIGEAITHVTDRFRNVVSTLGFDAVRDSLHPAVGLFIGDVFVYLNAGVRRDGIRRRVAESITKAHESAKSSKQPLVVVGHSMGGVILVDMLSNPTAAELPKDLQVDALITVGSQPGLFAALDTIAPVAPGSARSKPACIKHWLNVFDPIDPLAFSAQAIFKGATDLMFDSTTGISEAHSKYFQRPQFYARTRVRLRELGVL